MSADWPHYELYQHLHDADRSAFAWEWLRRSADYVRAWERYGRDARNPRVARQFGLEKFENPRLGTPHARAIWSANVDPSVIRSKIAGATADDKDRIDLRILSDLVTVTVDQNDIEHILLSDGLRNLRIDVLDGTLIGCPSALVYRVDELSRLAASISSLGRLTKLVARGRLDRNCRSCRRDRWILELRVGDALSTGASQQDIARILFPGSIPPTRWRTTEAYRQRVQRLARIARLRMLRPLDPIWFKAR